VDRAEDNGEANGDKRIGAAELNAIEQIFADLGHVVTS
jgi:hypothetical protein